MQWALPVVATTKKTTTWPQMWLGMKQAKRSKQVNMPESKHAKTGKKSKQEFHSKTGQRRSSVKTAANETWIWTKATLWVCATPATQNEGGCEFVPRLCHACHAKRRYAISAKPATQNDGGCEFVPRLPREWRWMSPSATPATKGQRRHRRQIRTKRATQSHKCHACHAKPRYAISATPATQRWMWVCATPATWNERGCHQVPHKGQRRHRRQIRTKRATQSHKWHACHAKRRYAISATPAMQNDGGCEFVPRLPREMKVDVTK